MHFRPVIRPKLLLASGLCLLLGAAANAATVTSTGMGSTNASEAGTTKMATTTAAAIHHSSKKPTEGTGHGSTTKQRGPTTRSGQTTAGQTSVRRLGRNTSTTSVAASHGPKTPARTMTAGTAHGIHRAGRATLPPRALVQAAPKSAVPAIAVPPAPAPVAVLDPNKGTDSGLPLPRFAALRSDQVSMRAGPGTRYPIDWIYQRRYLPVKIEREFEVWRLISQADGTKGWVHEAMLTGRRGFLVTGDQLQPLRASGNETSDPIAILKPGVVGRLLICPAAGVWCQVEVKAYKGWLPRSVLWGTLPNEVVTQ